MVCKGAIEEMLPLCVSADNNGAVAGGVVPFTTEMRKEVRRVTRKLNQEGLRALAVAYKWLPPEDRTYTVEDEKDFVLAGYVAFLDPPKETARQAIAALREYGVAVKIITGDNEVVTRKICKEVGLPIEHALLGKDVEKLSDAKLQEAAELTTIFAKMSPLQKSRVIRALQSKGHTVGYLGDGINDAAALKDADVGISVDTAVDIAKESADIILLEKSLLVLEEAVIEGRKTFANIIKYIKMTASSNFGNVFSVLIASIFLPFLPMLPIQLLVQNLLYDISQVSIPWDDVDQDYLKHTAQMGRRRHRALHGVHRSDQLDLRYRDLSRHVVCVRRQHGREAIAVSIRLVCRRLADANADRAHDPHPAYPLHPKPRRYARHSVDGLDHGFRHLSALLVARRASRHWCRCRWPISPGSPEFCSATACSRRW